MKRFTVLKQSSAQAQQLLIEEQQRTIEELKRRAAEHEAALKSIINSLDALNEAVFLLLDR